VAISALQELSGIFIHETFLPTLIKFPVILLLWIMWRAIWSKELNEESNN
jgi:hypothetical protein